MTVQSVVAVAAGGLLSLLPARPVHVGAGLLFLVSAIFMWIRKSEAPASADPQQASKLGEMLRGLADQQGVAVLLSDHHVAEALRVCTRAVSVHALRGDLSGA